MFYSPCKLKVEEKPIRFILAKNMQSFTGHNLTGIASQFAMHLGFTCDVISVTHRSD